MYINIMFSSVFIPVFPVQDSYFVRHPSGRFENKSLNSKYPAIIRNNENEITRMGVKYARYCAFHNHF